MNQGRTLLKAILLCIALAGHARASSRVLLPMDSGWKFSIGDFKEAEAAAFDDSAWRTVSVPHDWSIEGTFDRNNPAGQGGAFLPTGIGWYRKQFSISPADSRKQVFVDFDGVMANSDVWINGFHLGRRPSGYVSFRYELTGHLHFGGSQPNILAVRADNSAQPASRWYAGAGIYRHVRLLITDPVHLEHWGTFVTTPDITADSAAVHIQTTVVNQSSETRAITLDTTLIRPDGQPLPSVEASQNIAAGKSAVFQQEILVRSPKLWELAHPLHYCAVSRVRASGAVLDEETTRFGIRKIRFEPSTGFWLNDKNLKIKGVCLHEEAGGLGTAVPLAIWEQRLRQLKQIGVNAIRTAHNPFSADFLELCDRMGFLVMDEMFDCWNVGKNPYDYHLAFKEWSLADLRDSVLRDRNHPSIILYSIGNEIRDTPNAPLARSLLLSLRDECHKWDSTRPVTQALFRPNASHDYTNGYADLLDVVGQNYRENELIAAHREKPERNILGTENGHDRRVWLAMRDNPAYAGQFLWTGYDYLDEARRWPAIGSGSGLFDRIGTPKQLAYERQSWWSDQPMVHIVRRTAATQPAPTDPGYEPVPTRSAQVLFSDWTPQNTAPHEENIEVYSNCEEVELFLNGKSLGTQPLSPDALPRIWKVTFEAGTIKAVGKNKGNIVASHELHTAGAPARIVLTTNQNVLTDDWDDAACVSAVITDKDGTPCPSANVLISFKISGAGTLAAVDNGDLASHESFTAHERHAYQGQCAAIVRAVTPTGAITLAASAPGLESASLPIQTTAKPEAHLPALFIIGDSTVKNHTRGLQGWGDPIAGFFDKSKIRVENRALGGRSSRTFLTEGLWDKVLADLKPGDFVLMQFGHNDGGSLTQNRARASLKGNGDETQEVTDATTGKKETVHTFGWYLRHYITDAKSKGATPIVCSLIPRNIWKDDHTVARASNDYGKFAAEAARSAGANFIDLNELIAKRYEEIGQEKVKTLYFLEDHTHTTPAGAQLNAEMVVQGIRSLKDCPLKDFLLPASTKESSTQEK